MPFIPRLTPEERKIQAAVRRRQPGLPGEPVQPERPPLPPIPTAQPESTVAPAETTFSGELPGGRDILEAFTSVIKPIGAVVKDVVTDPRGALKFAQERAGEDIDAIVAAEGVKETTLTALQRTFPEPSESANTQAVQDIVDFTLTGGIRRGATAALKQVERALAKQVKKEAKEIAHVVTPPLRRSEAATAQRTAERIKAATKPTTPPVAAPAQRGPLAAGEAVTPARTADRIKQVTSAQTERFIVPGASAPATVAKITEPPANFANNVLGLRDITPGLTRFQTTANVVRNLLRKTGANLTNDDRFVAGAFRERQRVAGSVDSMANEIVARQDVAIKRTFPRNAQEGIEGLADIDPTLPTGIAPTIQDVAARLPRFLAHMTPAQIKFFQDLQQELAPFTHIFKEVGGTLDTRADVLDGGFYIPRGNVLQEGLDIPRKRRLPGTAGFEKTAEFPSMASGIADGQTYSPFAASLGSYLRDIGRRSTDQHLSNFFDTLAVDGGSRIELSGLAGKTFPDEIAAAAQKILVSEGRLAGEGANIMNVVRATNNLYRGFRSTGDNSFLFIQGLLGMAGDNRAYRAALKVNARSWFDEQVLGKFLTDFNETAIQRGTLSARDWARDGLRIGGADTEYRLGEGLTAKLGDLPGIRQANRAFGNMGDALRLEWADDLLKDEIAKGRTVAQIRTAGDVDRIADVVNNMTGFSRQRAGGPIGDLVLFAPRFLQSRISTIAKAVRSIGPNNTLEQRIARKSLLKLIGWGGLLTVGANEALGQDTDFRPFVDGRVNPDFMAIEWKGRKFKLFGPWDSLLRLMLTLSPAQPEIKDGEFQANVGFNKPHNALRSLSSGIVTNAWDFISGESLTGERRDASNPQDVGEALLRNVTPFSVEELPKAVAERVGRAQRGEPISDLVGDASAVAAEFVGLKNSPLTLTNLRDRQAREFFDKPFEQLNANEKALINSFSEVDTKIQEAENRGKRLSTDDTIGFAFRRTREVKTEKEEELLTQINAGRQGKAMRESFKSFRRDMFAVRQALFDENVNEQIQDNENNLETFRRLYWTVPVPENDETGELDFDKRDEERQALLDLATQNGLDVDFITARGPMFDNPVVEGKYQEFVRDQELLNIFWSGTNDQIRAEMPEQAQAIWDRWLVAGPVVKADLAKRNAFIGQANSRRTALRDRVLQQSPAMDKAMILWEYRSKAQTLEGEQLRLGMLAAAGQ